MKADTDAFYTDEELKLMDDHQLDEDEFDTLYGVLYNRTKEYGTDAMEAVYDLVKQRLLEE